MRAESEILKEIKKVGAAREAAEKKVLRCDARLEELYDEIGNTIQEVE